MKEYKVEVTLQYKVKRYVGSENEEDAMALVECDDDAMLPENGVDIVNIEAEEV